MRLVLIDDNAIFRLGLKLWLSRFPDLEVVAEIDNSDQAMTRLENQYQTGVAEADGSKPLEATSDNIAPSPASIDLVILSFSAESIQAGQLQGFELCQQIKTTYPTLPILVLSEFQEPVMVAAAQQAGANGYCLRNTPVQQLERIIRQVAAGQPYWLQATPSAAVVPSTSPQTYAPASIDKQLKLPGLLAIARRNLRLYGLHQIEAELTHVTQQLQTFDLSLWDQAVAAGRRRELQAARWLVKRLLATPRLPEPEPTAGDSTPSESARTSVPLQSADTGIALQPAIAADGLVSTPLPIVSPMTARNLQSILFDGLLAKLQSNLQNKTDKPLEIDILREDRKRELLYLTMRQLEDVLSDLRFSQVQPEQLAEKRSPILLDLWQAVLTDFFGKYYMLSIDGIEIEVVNTLLQDAEVVQTAILNKIPMVNDLLSHLLFLTPLVVDGRAYPAGNPEALLRAELLLDHLVLQIANSVMQPLLNSFADVETIKQNFYDRFLLSSREIERLRNNLSWKYRMERIVGEPKDIFESQYRLYSLNGRGIKFASIYAPRRQELEQLSGLQFAVTLALETRDAIAPRIRSTLSIIGSSVIYLLTDVLGRGIGLIGRGILKGLGNAWQDKNSWQDKNQ